MKGSMREKGTGRGEEGMGKKGQEERTRRKDKKKGQEKGQEEGTRERSGDEPV